MSGVVRRATQDLTNTPAHTVAPDGASEASPCRDAEAIVIAAIRYESDDHESVRPRAPLRADAREVLSRAECRHGPPQGLPAVRR